MVSYNCPDCGNPLPSGVLNCENCGRKLTIHDQIATVFVSDLYLGKTFHLDYFWDTLHPIYPDFKKMNLGLYDHAYGNKGGCRICAIEPNGGKPLFEANPVGSGFYKVLGGIIPFGE